MLSDTTKERLLSTLVWDRIMRRFGLPGIVGLTLIGFGFWKDTMWLIVTGLILAAPILWCYFLILLVFPLMLLFEKTPKQYWKE